MGQLRRMCEPGLEARNSGTTILAGGGEGYRLSRDVSGDLFELETQLGAARESGAGYEEVLRPLARQPFAGLDRMLADHPWLVALERQRVAVAVEALTAVTDGDERPAWWTWPRPSPPSSPSRRRSRPS